MLVKAGKSEKIFIGNVLVEQLAKCWPEIKAVESGCLGRGREKLGRDRESFPGIRNTLHLCRARLTLV